MIATKLLVMLGGYDGLGFEVEAVVVNILVYDTELSTEEQYVTPLGHYLTDAIAGVKIGSTWNGESFDPPVEPPTAAQTTMQQLYARAESDTERLRIIARVVGLTTRA